MKRQLIVPIITPFNEDESINYNELQRFTAHLLNQGADGIYAVGSSSECFLLSDEERKSILEAVVEASGGKTVIAHVGAVGTGRSVGFAEHAAKIGASGISSVPPFYFKYSFEQIRKYYWDLADATDLPLMMYYFPGNTGGSMSAGQIAEIMNGKDNIVSVKFTDSDFFAMQQVQYLTGKKVISGRDECFLSAIAVGADGAIGTTFNFMLGHFRKVLNLYEKGDTVGALCVQKKINNIIAGLGGNLFDSVKTLVGHQGFKVGAGRRPFLPMSQDERKKIIDIYKNNTL